MTGTTGTTGPRDDLGVLLAALDLAPDGDGAFAAPNVVHEGDRRIYGGQLVAQAVVAGSRCDPGKRVHSVHTVFARPARTDLPVRHGTRVVGAGRTFSTVLVEQVQVLPGRGAVAVAVSTVSLHAPDPGPLHQQVRPDAGGPEDAGPLASFLPWETRAVGGADLDDRAVAEPRFGLWMRAPGLSAPPEVHRALVAYASDWPLIGTSLRPLPGLAERDSPARLQTAVVAHTVTFHAEPDLSAWLLLDNRSVLLRDGRGHGRAEGYDGDGRLVLSVSQEHLVRPTA